MDKKLTLEEVRKKTMEVLGTNDPKDVAYITQELIDQDYEEDTDFSEEKSEAGLTQSVIYGHNMHYCYRDGEYSYCYQRGNNPPTIGNACGHNNKYVKWSSWNHESTSRKCSHSGSADHRLITKFYK